MSTVLTRPQSVENRLFAKVAVLAGLVGMAVIFGFPALDPPTELARLTVTNPLAWNVDVAVDGPELEGRIPVGTVNRGQPATFHAILDAGREWTFRFGHAGYSAGAVTVDRDRLRAAGWKLSIPLEVGEILQTAGVPESVD